VGLAVAIALIACCGFPAGYLVVRGITDAASKPAVVPLAKGGCVGTGETFHYQGVRCDDPRRIGQVLEILDNMDADAAQSCDPASDQLLTQDGKVLCVGAAGSQHVSVPGYGGGVLVPGDCVHLKLGWIEPTPTEAACGPAYEAKVVARTDAPAECKAPAVHFEKLSTRRGPVLCLATGPAIAGAGQCLHIKGSEVDFAVVPCTAGNATHKVLGRAPSEGGCPSGVTSYADDLGGLPRTKVICFRKLKNGTDG
jgi:hypothetical protein